MFIHGFPMSNNQKLFLQSFVAKKSSSLTNHGRRTPFFSDLYRPNVCIYIHINSLKYLNGSMHNNAFLLLYIILILYYIYYIYYICFIYILYVFIRSIFWGMNSSITMDPLTAIVLMIQSKDLLTCWVSNPFLGKSANTTSSIALYNPNFEWHLHNLKTINTPFDSNECWQNLFFRSIQILTFYPNSIHVPSKSYSHSMII